MKSAEKRYVSRGVTESRARLLHRTGITDVIPVDAPETNVLLPHGRSGDRETRLVGSAGRAIWKIKDVCARVYAHSTWRSIAVAVKAGAKATGKICGTFRCSSTPPGH